MLTYTLNNKGQVVGTQTYNRSYASGEAADMLVQREIYELDEYGNRVKMTRYYGDSTVPAVIETYENNSLGQRVKAYFDANADTIPDYIIQYHHNSNNQVIRQETLAANGVDIVDTSIYERNALGQATTEKFVISSNGSVETRINSFDSYGNLILRKDYYTEDLTTPSITREWTYNELGQQTVSLRTYADGTVLKWTRTFDAQGRTIIEEYDRGNNGVDEISYIQEFNSDNKPTKVFIDNNGNKTFDSGDIMRVSKFSDVFNSEISRHEYTDEAMTKLRRVYFYDLNEAGKNTTYAYDWNGDSVIDQFGFGGGISNINHAENITQWDATRWEKLGSIREITMNTVTVGTVILDKDTLANFTSDRLYIFGGSEKDTVVLLNGKTDFTKTKDNVESGDRTYDVYTTTDGKALWIEDGITIDLDGTGII